ncbi:uncharacterized protein DUF4397 [Tamilnaduibacter salinus]|uniref:Uncharacterized protein DUF4397 n=1 Tax=Tamilnaduibacter salinus TaxID=1484056 RepID=A0A2U1CTY5_9GAMM|nr:DUF4397 domain-containing protein [Tamilnaduibacter salinus]PVY70085.1 uncharacterized protein DUF4397 [Tamilnaduibacter salinus]
MKKPILVTSIMAASVGLGGCFASATDSSPTADLRVLHASPDAPSVDVLIDGERVLEDVSYQSGSDYLTVDPGNALVEIQAGGETVIEQTVTLTEGGSFSVIAQGTLNAEDDAEFGLNVLDDTDRRDNGTNDVTVLHAAPSPAAASVDIYVTGPGDELPQAPTLNDVSFDTNATLPEIADGDYQVRITGADSQDPVLYDSGALTVNTDVTAVAVNSTQSASPVSLLVWAESDPAVTTVLDNSAEVRVVHAVDAAPVDVFVDGSKINGAEPFEYTDILPVQSGVRAASTAEQGGQYLTVEPGERAVAIAAAGQGVDNALDSLSGTLTLERGKSYTVVAAGDDQDLPNAQLIVLEDRRTASDSNQADVRLVHAAAAAAADPVDIFVLPDGETPQSPTFDDVTIGEDTGYSSLASGTYDFTVAADGTTANVVPGTQDVPIQGGQVLTSVVVGDDVSNLEPIGLDDSRP